jgi:hypothetical protein
MNSPLRQIQEDATPLDLWWTALESAQRTIKLPLSDDFPVLHVAGHPEKITAGQIRKMLNSIYQINQEPK